MKNILNIENQTNFKFLYKKEFLAILNEVAIFFKEEYPIEVDVNIVNNKKILNIYKEYLKKEKITDILSFPSNMKNYKKVMGFYHLGEIFLNYEKILLQAKNYNHSNKREFSYLFTHGLIHLYGYDHVNKEEEKIMNGIVDNVMNKINIKRY